MRVADDGLLNAVAPLGVGVRHRVTKRRTLPAFGLSDHVTPLIVKESFSVGDEELEITHLWRIDGREVDLGNHAVGYGVPEAAGNRVRRSDRVLGAEGPLGNNP